MKEAGRVNGKVNMQRSLEGEWPKKKAGRGRGESGRGEGDGKGICRGQKWEWLKEAGMGWDKGGRKGTG